MILVYILFVTAVNSVYFLNEPSKKGTRPFFVFPLFFSFFFLFIREKKIKIREKAAAVTKHSPSAIDDLSNDEKSQLFT